MKTEHISFGIDWIFEKGDDGTFTDEALLYQDIIKHAIKLKKSANEKNSNELSFSVYELAKWLRYNHNNYMDRYSKKPLSNVQTEIESLQKGVGSRVDNLIQLELIKSIGTRQSTRGKGPVAIYTYTEFGFLFAWLLEDESEDRATITSEVYDLIQSIFRTGRYAPSYWIFYSEFFKMCRKCGRFQDIVDLIRNTLTSNDLAVTTIVEFIHQIQRLDFKDPTQTIFFSVLLWDQIFNRLDPQIKSLVMYTMKVEIERRMDLQVKNGKNYEKLRFKIRDDPEMIAIEGYCSKCMYYIPGAVDVLEYKMEMISANTINQPVLFIRCPNCKSDKSFRIPILN
ncbi:MAG TPA: hypothetical protein VH796_16065 [Nitrososphaeraceae archaeon]